MCPVHPEGPTDMYELEDWQLDSRDYRSQVFEYANFTTGLYTIILGQCTDTMKDKLKSHPKLTAAHQNGIALLKLIKTILYSFEEASHEEDELMVMKRAIFSFTQGNNMSLQQYYELTLGYAAVLEE